MKKNKMSGGKMVAVSAGVVALSAGAYYLLGPGSKAHQEKAKNLLAKMKKEVAQKVTKVKNLTEPLYHNVVDALTVAYSKQHKAHEKDIKAFAKKLKSEYKSTIKIAKNKVRESIQKVKTQVKKAKSKAKK